MQELPKDFRNRCEKIAVGERHKLGLPAYVPMRGEALAEFYGIHLVTPDELTGITLEMREAFLQQEENWGILIRGPRLAAPLILIKPNQPPARYQSTICHELAHFLLEHDGGGDFAALLNGTSWNKRQEAEAKYLGGCLQITQAGMRWALQVGLSFERTMEHFGASRAMVQYRCNVTGITLSKGRRRTAATVGGA